MIELGRKLSSLAHITFMIDMYKHELMYFFFFFLFRRFENLVKRFGNINWRFSDTHGEMMSLRTYAKYIHSVEGEESKNLSKEGEKSVLLKY